MQGGRPGSGANTTHVEAWDGEAKGSQKIGSRWSGGPGRAASGDGIWGGGEGPDETRADIWAHGFCKQEMNAIFDVRIVNFYAGS